MQPTLIFTLINIVFNVSIAIISYKLLRKSEILGNFKVPFTIHPVKNWRALKPYYVMTIDFKDTSISQTISEENYYMLKDSTDATCDVTIRKFKKAYLNSNGSQYEFSLEETDWETKDKSSCIKGFLYVTIAFELLYLIIAYQL